MNEDAEKHPCFKSYGQYHVALGQLGEKKSRLCINQKVLSHSSSGPHVKASLGEILDPSKAPNRSLVRECSVFDRNAVCTKQNMFFGWTAVMMLSLLKKVS